ncbi:MAG: D-2-hydroxyacid dehydrogenase family protein [Rhizobacter sp.]|nr:D-2-hydroxyacid dehydrogenase family protein [Bacteriovorax sp.]
MKIAVLDDYQNVALNLADWSKVKTLAEITVFNDHLADSEAVIKRLLPYDIICVMRERTPMTAAILNRLPQLKLIVSTGGRNASIDLEAAEKNNIKILFTGYTPKPAIELTWALILGLARNITSENTSFKNNGWQEKIGADLNGKTLALLGLGNIGSEVALIGKAFGMNLIAWSQNLTVEKAEAAGAKLVTKEELFYQADFLSVHLVLSPRSKGIVGKNELALMKPDSFFINTSRGPLVDEAALIEVLTNKKIAGAAVDVYDVEPLTKDHPFRKLDNILATPHIGYVTKSLYEIFYKDTVANILKWCGEGAS